MVIKSQVNVGDKMAKPIYFERITKKYRSKLISTRETGQLSLTDLGLMAKDFGIKYELDVPDYSWEEKMRLERELLSISIVEHPFARYKRMINRDQITRIGNLKGLCEGNRVTVAGQLPAVTYQKQRLYANSKPVFIGQRRRPILSVLRGVSRP